MKEEMQSETAQGSTKFVSDAGFWLSVGMLLSFLIPFVARYPQTEVGEILRLSPFRVMPLFSGILLLLTFGIFFLRIKRNHAVAQKISIVTTIVGIVAGGWLMFEGKREGPALVNALNSLDQPSIGMYLFVFLSYYSIFVGARFERSWRYGHTFFHACRVKPNRLTSKLKPHLYKNRLQFSSCFGYPHHRSIYAQIIQGREIEIQPRAMGDKTDSMTNAHRLCKRNIKDVKFPSRRREQSRKTA